MKPTFLLYIFDIPVESDTRPSDDKRHSLFTKRESTPTKKYKKYNQSQKIEYYICTIVMSLSIEPIL